MKKILLVIAFSLLSGCSAIDAYFMAKYDTNEYAAITLIRSQAETAQALCGDKAKVSVQVNEIYNTSTYFKNFTQARERNDDTAAIAYNIYQLSDQLKKYYDTHETVSPVYCKMKLEQVEKGAITAQRTIGSKPR